MIRTALLTTAAVLAASTAAGAALVQSFEFDTPGDTEGFNGANVTGPLVVAGGLLTGTTVSGGGDPQLINPATSGRVNLTPAMGETFDRIEFRVRELEGVTPVNTFSSAGLFVALNSAGFNGNAPTAGLYSAAADGEYFIVTVDISSYAGTLPVTSIRLDPIGGPDAAGNTFNVDYIRIFDTAPIPEPTSALGIMAGGLLLAARRRR